MLFLNEILNKFTLLVCINTSLYAHATTLHVCMCVCVCECVSVWTINTTAMHRQQQFSDTTNIKHTTTLILLACDMIVLRFLLIVFFHCGFFCAKGAFFDFFFWAKLLYNSKYMYVQKSICQKLFFLGKWFSQLLLVIEVGFCVFILLKKE